MKNKFITSRLHRQSVNLFSSVSTSNDKKGTESVPSIDTYPCKVDYKKLEAKSACGNISSLRKTADKTEKPREDLKKFEDIPGPKALPFIGTLWKYTPLIGTYSFDRLHINASKNFQKYGKIVKEPILPNVNILHLFDPHDIEVVFRNEGKFPERLSHLPLTKYRTDRRDTYNSGGLLPTNGPEWWRLRTNFQKSLSSPAKVKAYIGIINSIITEFVDRVKFVECDQKKKSSTDDFLDNLSRLSLELISVIAFDVRINSFAPDELKKNSKTTRLIDAALISNSCILKLDRGTLWKYFNTPLYRKFCKAQDYMEQVAVDLVSQKMSFFDGNYKEDDSREPSLLETYLSNSEIDLKDIVGMTMDFLLAAIDTTAYSTSFLLYHIANNPSVQEKLFKETLMLLPKDDDDVTADVLSRASYTKACLKESLRINPVSVGVGRVTTTDVALSGYHVPKGTVIVTQNYVSCRLSEYFSQPLSFIPERWIKGTELYKSQSPFLSIPFGHGPRTCIARRFAEQNMQITLMKLIRKFEIGWDGGKLGFKTLLINKPDQPIKLTFRYRNI